jgi:hypothetical protein
VFFSGYKKLGGMFWLCLPGHSTSKKYREVPPRRQRAKLPTIASPLRHTHELLLLPHYQPVISSSLLTMSTQLGIPTVCANEGHMTNLMKCFIEYPKCKEKCFTFNFSRNAGLFDIPDYMLQEGAAEIMDCSEIEGPVCAYTECRDCEPCTDIINALYRCVIAYSTTVDPKLKTMANCPLDCSGDSFLLASGDFEDADAPGADAVNGTESGNFTDTVDIDFNRTASVNYSDIDIDYNGTRFLLN